MKVKRSLLSMFSGMVNNFTKIILGIVITRLLIVSYGSEMNGMIASVTSIFVYLSLLEAGVGSASRQALYAPIVKKDQNKINGIMSATSRYYYKTGIFLLACVLILAFTYPIVIKSNISYSIIAAVILVMSVTTLVKYFFLGKYTVLLTADNRTYVLSWFETGSIILIGASQIVMLLSGYNVIIVQISAALITVLKIIIFQKLYVNKHYYHIDFSVEPDNAAISQKNAVLLIQIKGVIFNNIDVLILSIFCNLKIVSVYAVYNLIFKGISSIPTTLYTGLTTSFGHLYEENFTKFKRTFNAFEVYYTPMVFTLFIVTYILVIPFVKLYTNGVTDINYVDYWMPLLFLAINLLISLRYCPDRVIFMAGHFKSTQRQATIEMAINLILSIILVTFLGVYGVLLASVLALVYRCIDLVVYTSRNILLRSSMVPFRRWLTNLALGAVIIFLIQCLNIKISGYLNLLLVGIALILIIGTVYFILISIIEKDARKLMLEYLKVIFTKILQIKPERY